MTAPSEAKILEYRGQVERLLPPGILWRQRDNSVMRSLLTAVATEFARVDERAADALLESDPRVTQELLEDWERFLGLPDPCAVLEDTRQLRRFAVVAKLTKRGGQSRVFFVELAAALGYVVTVEDIEEYKTFRAGPQSCQATEGGAFDCGSKAGDELAASPQGSSNPSWLWAWTVHAPEHTGVFFDAESGAAGEPLVSTGNALLECHFRQSAPAHTVVTFEYDQPWVGYAPWTEIRPSSAVLSFSNAGVVVERPT